MNRKRVLSVSSQADAGIQMKKTKWNDMYMQPQAAAQDWDMMEAVDANYYAAQEHRCDKSTWFMLKYKHLSRQSSSTVNDGYVIQFKDLCSC